MTESHSMPAPASSDARQAAISLIEQRSLVERLARDMRLASGNELPHSFCIVQVQRQLAKGWKTSALDDTTAHLASRQQHPRSVFHSWAMKE